MKNKALTMAAVAGLGILGYQMYKKMNPNMMEDAKRMAKDAASKMLVKLENMD